MTTPASTTPIDVDDGNVYPTNANGDVVIGERSMDEIEGSLLPVARQIQGITQVLDIDGQGAMAATPIETFDYDAAIAAEAQAEREPLVAHPIPSSNSHNPDSIADDSRTAVKHAERSGRQRAEEELEAIRNANRKVHAHNYFEQQEFRAANEKAQQRNAEGLQLPSPPASATASLTSSTTSSQKAEPKHHDPGYQVQEYQIGKYETSSYDVQEYKSVYD